MDSLIVLVHSPLVGPFTWSLVAQRLQAAGFDVLVPGLTDTGEAPPAYWQQHTASVQRALASIPVDRPLVLAGHSGAGPLLPILAQAANHPVRAYLFLDASLPHPNQSRLDEMEASVPDIAQELRQLLTAGERFPHWMDEDLCDDLPDEYARRRVLAELQPRSLDFFTEIMPDVPGWPDAPGGYLLFTPGYLHFLEQAEAAGWPTQAFHTSHAGHFHMLVDPDAVASALIDLTARMQEQPPR